MEFVERYVNKYASADYNSCADESLTHQFKSLLTQCQSYNNKVKCNHLAKMVKKIKMANEILALLKMKVIAENKAEQWRNEKVQFREDLEKFGESLIVAASTSEEHISELEELREKVELLAKQNDLLEEKLKDCEEMCRLREQEVISLESKAGYELNVPVSVCPVTEQEIKDGEQGIRPQTLPSPSLFSPQSECARQQINNTHGPTDNNIHSNSAALKIQEVISLTQILGTFDTNLSPISLSNKLEAVVKQYNLGNKDACALLRAWLPYQLAAELRPPVGKHIGTLSNINENWGSTTERLRELQRILGGRDIRGTNALENARYRKGDDPMLFCTDYLSLYKVVFNCPDMLPDEPNFLYSMANKCNVDYNTRTALRYATTYNNFINTLRDWSQESFEFQRHISVASKNNQSRRFPRKCYSCGKYGHIARFCRTSANQHDTYPIHSIQRQEGDAQENLNDYLLDHSPPSEPETVVSSDNIDTGSNSAGDQKESQNEPKREFHTPPCKTGKEGTTAPPFMPWVNIPLWLYSSWSHIAMQMLMANLAQFAQGVPNTNMPVF
ncbi:posterior protein-like [Xenopus laevis]|uniref:Posterior protein-like n=1 Tax=Xenopus laevis TaxID=8355 RepID=A0A8J1LPR3_XENLA|nr:posterior protein-like [Xenopus laevis]